MQTLEVPKAERYPGLPQWP